MNVLSAVADVPRPKGGRQHGPEPGLEYWPCGHSICAACTALMLGPERRCEFRDEEGRRCCHAKGHRIGDPIPDHLVLPAGQEVEPDA